MIILSVDDKRIDVWPRTMDKGDRIDRDNDISISELKGERLKL